MKRTGIAILILGVVLTIFTSVDFFTKEKVVDIGSVEITRNKPHYMQWSPLLGIALIVVGGVILLKESKK